MKKFTHCRKQQTNHKASKTNIKESKQAILNEISLPRPMPFFACCMPLRLQSRVLMAQTLVVKRGEEMSTTENPIHINSNHLPPRASPNITPSYSRRSHFQLQSEYLCALQLLNASTNCIIRLLVLIQCFQTAATALLESGSNSQTLGFQPQ